MSREQQPLEPSSKTWTATSWDPIKDDSESDVCLVRLRWEDEPDAFAAAVVQRHAVLADVRQAITNQIQDDLRDGYQFVCDGLTITTIQERLIPIQSISSLTLRNLSETDEAFRSAKGVDQVVDRPSPSSTVSSNDVTIAVSGETESNRPPVTPSQLTFPLQRPYSSDTTGRSFLARVHISGQDVVAFDDLPTLVDLLHRLKESETTSRSVTWVDVQSTNANELERIGQSLDLHPLTIEDISVVQSRQKVEGFRQYMLVIFHGLPLPHEDRHYFESLSMVVSSSLVFTIHHADVPTLDYVRRRLARTYKKDIPCTATLVHAIADCIVDYDTLIVDECVQEVDSLEELVYILSQSEQTDLLRRMQLVGKRLTLLHQISGC